MHYHLNLKKNLPIKLYDKLYENSDGEEYLLVASGEDESKNLGDARSGALRNCRSNLIPQFIKKRAEAKNSHIDAMLFFRR